MGASFNSETKKTWQGRRARARVSKPAGGVQAHPSLVARWRSFRFGREHSPLAPPPLRGYNWMAAGLAAGANFWDETGGFHHTLSKDELQWLDFHGMLSSDENAVRILREVQQWDVKVVRILQKQNVRTPNVSEGSETVPSMFSLLLLGASKTTRKRKSAPRRRGRRTKPSKTSET